VFGRDGMLRVMIITSAIHLLMITLVIFHLMKTLGCAVALSAQSGIHV
jgi:hypothetical protein